MANEHSQIVPSMQPTSTVADFKFWCQKVLPLVYDDSISYYEVLGKMVVYLNQVIDNINATTANVAELEDDFLLLQNYVNNFFDDIGQLVTYTERAEAAQTAAAASAISAATSASNSATSASNSAGSASSAATSALSALDAKDAAVAAKTAAETALASAQSAATNASASATAASGSATNAAASATAAQNSFTLADAARSAAQSAATSAESDAEDAADSAAEAIAAVDTIINGLGNITKTIENVPIATTEDALASIAKKIVVAIEPVQSGSGDPSPVNERPITGWTGANVIMAEKNLWGGSKMAQDLAEIVNATIDSSAKTVSFTGSNANGKVIFNKFEASTQYTFIMSYGTGNNDGNWNVKYTDGTVVKLNQTNAVYVSTSGKSVESLVGSWYSGTTILNYEECGIFKGVLTAPDFEPYQATTYSITFPAGAGTVYGGTLTNEGTDTWKLSVDIFKRKLNTMEWRYYNGSFYTNNSADYTKAKNNLDGICNIYKTFNGTGAPDDSICFASHVLDGNNRISVVDNDYSNVTDFVAFLTEADAEIATRFDPVEYTFTDAQVITLLNEINNVWADTGNILILEYFTNAENYVTSQVDLAKSLIAPVLKEMKADTALVANDFRIVGNTLYRITANIASGGTLTPNTNCVATTVGAILKSLLSA